MWNPLTFLWEPGVRFPPAPAPKGRRWRRRVEGDVRLVPPDVVCGHAIYSAKAPDG